MGQRCALGEIVRTMRILVTGGFGYVGGRVAQLLQQNGHQIVLGSRKLISPPHWLQQAEVEQIKWDDVGELERICKGFDAVIQAAGMNAQDCANDPIAALAFNGVATARLVEAASRAGVQKFIYLSTAHVYSSLLEGTITEDSCPRNLHPYSSSHLAGECVVLNAGQRGQLKGIVLRLSNAFGPPFHKDVNCWTLLVNDLCRQAAEKRSITLRTTGEQRRDFVTLQDVSRATSHLLNLNYEHLGYGVFNVGGAWTPRVIEIAEFIQARCSEVLGFVPSLIRKKPEKNEVAMELNYSISRLLATGFELTGNAATEIDNTLMFCQQSFSCEQ